MLKTGILFKSKASGEVAGDAGLVYGTAKIGDLVNKDTDGDGVLDWEESLWGTNPNSKETTLGIPDNVAIEKLKAVQGVNIKTGSPTTTGSTENLTETDKFSREFFSTVAALNQSGSMDQATMDKLSTSLAERIQNTTPRKVYTLADIKIAPKDDLASAKIYNNALDDIYKKYPVSGNALDILQRFIIDENNVDSSVLPELVPITTQTSKIITELVKISVPQSLASLHLDFINGLQRTVENLDDITLYDTDVILALSGISQYPKNAETLKTANGNLINAINQKLNL